MRGINRYLCVHNIMETVLLPEMSKLLRYYPEEPIKRPIGRGSPVVKRF